MGCGERWALGVLTVSAMVVSACTGMRGGENSPSGIGAGSGWGEVLPPAATQKMPSAADAVRAHPAEIRLWPGAAPGSEKFTGKDAQEVVDWRTENDSITGEPFTFPIVTNIHTPSLTPYLPKNPRKGMPAVIIAPGGGHQFLTINHEGYDVAQYFADHGIAAFVLKYRLARARTYPANTYAINVHALADGQRALRLVRSRAAEWGIDPGKIGFMGFSAGGEVAVQVNLHPTDAVADSQDPVDRVPCTMNFEALIYPGVSRAIQPTKAWPPVFLACSFDDRADIAGAAGAGGGGGGSGREGGGAASRPAPVGLADVYLRYKAVGVPAELHVYSVGGHGFGMRRRGIEESGWGGAFVAWLKDQHLLK